MVVARGGDIRGFGEGPGYLFGGEGGIVLMACEAEKRGGRGLGWEEMVKEHLCYLAWVRGPW